MSSGSENEFDIEGLSDITVDSDIDSYLSGDENTNAHDILTAFSDNLSEIIDRTPNRSLEVQCATDCAIHG